MKLYPLFIYDKTKNISVNILYFALLRSREEYIENHPLNNENLSYICGSGFNKTKLKYNCVGGREIY